jgi:hypothetical protein
MARSNREPNGCDPRDGECRTKHIAGDFFQCLAKNPKCMYAYPAGPSYAYCLHTSKRMFEQGSCAGTLATLVQCQLRNRISPEKKTRKRAGVDKIH